MALLPTALLFAGCRTADQDRAPAESTFTEVIEYSPPAPTGPEVEGNCFTSSLAVWREGAYRCTGNEILDPCFAVDGATDTVVCGGYPLAESYPFTLRLTEPLPTEQPVADPRHAWLVRLADGTECGFVTGATMVVDGERLNFVCTDESWLVGDLVPGDPWTARQVSLNDQLTPSAAPEEVSIQTVIR